MRAICGAIISAGALIGLGMAALGIGTRYQSYGDLDSSGATRYLLFKNLDTPLMLILVLLVAALVVGMAIAFIGLAYHQHRRHHEMLLHRRAGEPASRLPM